MPRYLTGTTLRLDTEDLTEEAQALAKLPTNTVAGTFTLRGRYDKLLGKALELLDEAATQLEQHDQYHEYQATRDGFTLS